MRISRLKSILSNLPTTRIMVIGDFFLDQYWRIDPLLEERSVETGLEAHQVVQVRLSPGAAGTVTNNLSALGVGRISVLGCIGRDGNGYEISRRLKKQGVGIENLFASSKIYTPTYTKPMFKAESGAAEREGNRFDIKNRDPLPRDLEELILETISREFNNYDAVSVLDQVQEIDSGVVTRRVIQHISELALQHPEVKVIADSRAKIDAFQNVLVKPNIHEASRAFETNPEQDLPGFLRKIAENRNSQILMTRGERGIATWDGTQFSECPALPVEGDIDIVGAGDSVTAAAISALASGADLAEASQVAVLASNVTIQKIGTTGTASPAEILATAERYRDLEIFAD